MGLWQSMKYRKEVARLADEYEATPTIENCALLAERFIAVDDLGEAERVVTNGLERFGRSERLEAIHRFLKKSAMAGRMRELEHLIKEHPLVQHFVELAGIYRELGNPDKAVELCKDCLKQFPDTDSSYLVLGEVRLERFYDDLLAQDGVMAAEYFKKVLKLNTGNYKAYLHLARLYLMVGAVSQGIKVLKELLLVIPGDGFATELLGRALSKPMNSEEILEEFLKAVEETGELKYREFLPEDRQERDTERIVTAEEIAARFLLLRDLEGVRGVVVMEPEGKNPAGFVSAGMNLNDLAVVVGEVMKEAQSAARRMNIGRALRCSLQGPFGCLHVAMVASRIVGVSTARRANESLVFRRMHRLVTG